MSEHDSEGSSAADKREHDSEGLSAADRRGTSDAGPQYTETVVEYVDNRRRKAVLAALEVVLVLLIILLVGSAVAVLYFTKGSGAPAEKDLPKDVEWVRSIYGWGKTADTSLAAPTDVAVAPDGGIWTISAAQAIVGFNPDGSFKKLIRPKRGFEKGQVDTLEGITVGSDGTIYVTDQGKGAIERFDQDGTWLGEWGVALPISVATNGGDKLAVTGEGALGLLSVEGDTAKVLGSWGQRGKGPEDLDLPHGVAFGENDVMFVSDTQNARVKAYDKNGKILWVTEGAPRTSIESTVTTATALFQLPAGMTLDGNGRLVVVDPFGFNITVLDPKTGKKLAQYGAYGSQDGFFGYPTGIAYDEDRDWFVVADTSNNRLQITRIPGSGGSPVAALRRSLVGPTWICCIPLFLLLAALIALFLRRRARAAAEEGAVERSEEP